MKMVLLKILQLGSWKFCIVLILHLYLYKGFNYVHRIIPFAHTLARIYFFSLDDIPSDKTFHNSVFHELFEVK